MLSAIEHLEAITQLGKQIIGLKEARAVMHLATEAARNLAQAKYDLIRIANDDQAKPYLKANTEAIRNSVETFFTLHNLYFSDIDPNNLSLKRLDLRSHNIFCEQGSEGIIHRGIVAEALFQGQSLSRSDSFQYESNQTIINGVKIYLGTEVEEQRDVIKQLADDPELVDATELVYQDLITARLTSQAIKLPYYEDFFQAMMKLSPDLVSLITPAITNPDGLAYNATLSQLKSLTLNEDLAVSEIVRLTLTLQKLRVAYCNEFHGALLSEEQLWQTRSLADLPHNGDMNALRLAFSEAWQYLHGINQVQQYQLQTSAAKIHLNQLRIASSPEAVSAELDAIIESYQTLLTKAIVPKDTLDERTVDPIKAKLESIYTDLQQGNYESLKDLIKAIHWMALRQNSVKPEEAADLMMILSRGLAINPPKPTESILFKNAAKLTIFDLLNSLIRKTN